MNPISFLQKTAYLFHKAKLGRLGVRKALNLAVNWVEFGVGKQVCISRPFQVDVVITDVCNIDCVFCKNKFHGMRGETFLDPRDFQKLAPHVLPWAAWLNICSGGEPYLHRQLEEILGTARRYRVNTFVLSNAMVLDEGRMREIIREDLISRHGFSVDGIRPETVERIRRHAKFQTILENIRMVRRLIVDEGKAGQEVLVRYALMRSNVEELPDAVDFWGREGIAYLDCDYVSLCRGIDSQESLFFHPELTDRLFREARRVAERYPGMRLRLPDRGGAREEKGVFRRCRFPWNFVFVDIDGSVKPCYKAYEALNMGSIYDGFENIWNGERYRKLRGSVRNAKGGVYFPYCNVCETRIGWAGIEQHMGDYTWQRVLSSDSPTRGEGGSSLP